jgi:hypothetical protein
MLLKFFQNYIKITGAFGGRIKVMAKQSLAMSIRPKFVFGQKRLESGLASAQIKGEGAPRPGFEPGSSGRQPLILFRQHEKIRTVTGLYYLGRLRSD